MPHPITPGTRCPPSQKWASMNVVKQTKGDQGCEAREQCEMGKFTFQRMEALEDSLVLGLKDLGLPCRDSLTAQNRYAICSATSGS